MLLIVQPKVAALTARPGGERSWPLRTALAGVGVYVGYFGAAAGILLLAVLSAMLDQPLARVNAVKNVVSRVGNAVAAWNSPCSDRCGGRRRCRSRRGSCGRLIGPGPGPADSRAALRLGVGLGGVGLAVRLGLTAYR